MFKETMCPCCGRGVIRELYEICPVCGWEYDRVQQENPELEGGANEISLNQAREAYAASLETVIDEAEACIPESAAESYYDEENSNEDR